MVPQRYTAAGTRVFTLRIRGVRGLVMPKPRVPTRLKVIRGTFRNNEAPGNEPDPEKILRVPKAPVHLNRWAKKMWKDIADELIRLGMLTTIDLYSLEVLCEQYGIYRELKDSITHIANPDGTREKITIAQYLAGRNSQTVPEYAAMRAAFERFSALLKEFGLSPASRSRIDLPMKPPAEKDPMEELLDGTR